MPDTRVVYLDSTMTGAPELSGTAGALVGVLDACLVDGCGSVTLDSLVVAGNVATGTVGTGHHFAMLADGVGPVVVVSGATPSGLNGRWRLASVPNATTFTFATSGISNQTASGTIAAKRAPAGWEKAFSATDKAAYRAVEEAGARLYCRVEDTAGVSATVALVRGYEAMTGIDAGTGPFPTDAQNGGTLYARKSTVASGTARPWAFVGDEAAFYLWIGMGGGPIGEVTYFGDLMSLVEGETFGCGLHAAFNSASAENSHNFFNVFNNGTTSDSGFYLARGANQVGAAIPAQKIGVYNTGTRLGACAYPRNPSDANYAYVGMPIYVLDRALDDAGACLRGRLPGALAPVGNGSQIVAGVPVSTDDGGVLLPLNIAYGSYPSRLLLDLLGPWR
ncbi:MAG: hypothetical protein RKR03_09255 [Candidatus Competibacter sp.]|nr:hypothetical protein [Candidatus Competibacter sp.]